VDINSSKRLIDTYGTCGLLYHWFPKEAQEILKATDRPRSEFFAVRHGFLREILEQRWYAYEQTMVMLLYGISTKKAIGRFPLGDISDLPLGRESLTSAMQQVERAERVLKSVWRERNQQQSDWIERFQELEAGSEQVRRVALLILRNLLR
jgi:hypothetical protein